MPGDLPELLPLPPRRVLEQIRTHLADDHGVGTPRPADAVYRGGLWQEGQHITWDPGKGSFHCDLCEVTHASGEITPEMVERTLAFDRALDTFLVGAGSQAERVEIARRYLSGELSGAVLHTARKLGRRPSKQLRPGVEHRKRQVQGWMLAEYEKRGVFERVAEEALRLQREEPARWAQMSDRPLGRSTLSRYWQEIDDAEIAAARTRFEQHQGK